MKSASKLEYVCFREKSKQKQKEALMDISSTVTPNSHPKSILNTLKSTGALRSNAYRGRR